MQHSNPNTSTQLLSWILLPVTIIAVVGIIIIVIGYIVAPFVAWAAGIISKVGLAIKVAILGLFAAANFNKITELLSTGYYSLDKYVNSELGIDKDEGRATQKDWYLAGGTLIAGLLSGFNLFSKSCPEANSLIALSFAVVLSCFFLFCLAAGWEITEDWYEYLDKEEKLNWINATLSFYWILLVMAAAAVFANYIGLIFCTFEVEKNIVTSINIGLAIMDIVSCALSLVSFTLIVQRYQELQTAKSKLEKEE